MEEGKEENRRNEQKRKKALTKRSRRPVELNKASSSVV